MNKQSLRILVFLGINGFKIAVTSIYGKQEFFYNTGETSISVNTPDAWILQTIPEDRWWIDWMIDFHPYYSWCLPGPDRTQRFS